MSEAGTAYAPLERNPFRLGEWIVQPQDGTLCSPSASRRLEPQLMNLLLYLASRPGVVASKQEILERASQARHPELIYLPVSPSSTPCGPTLGFPGSSQGSSCRSSRTRRVPRLPQLFLRTRSRAPQDFSGFSA